MKQKFLIIFIGAWSCWSGCDQAVKREKPGSAMVPSAMLQIDDRLTSTDSMVFVFYKDPYRVGNDSLRYQRFYTQHSITGKATIALLNQNLNLPFEKFEQAKKCRSEGKIWCYAKGKIFQTIYFSTKCNDCCFLYLIRNGFFYYVPLNNNLSSRLGIVKQISREPAAGEKK